MQKKVIILQKDSKDCGICCIQSILKYYDGYASLEKIRKDTYSCNKGTSAFHIVETLKKYGFDCYGAKVKKENFKKEKIPLPAIVHVVLDNGLNHYIVLYEIRKENVILMDPAFGKRVMSMTDFFWMWTEVAIIMYPKNSIICMPKETASFFLFWQYLGKEKKRFYKLLCLHIMVFILIIGSSFYLKLELTQINQKENQIFLFIFFLIIMILQLIATKALVIEERNTNKLLELKHVSSLMEHINKISLSNYCSRMPSDYIQRIEEQKNLKLLYTKIVQTMTLSNIVLIIGLFLLFLLNKHFFLYFLTMSIIYLIIEFFFQKESSTLEKQELENEANFKIKMTAQLETKEIYHYLNIEKVQMEKIETELVSYLKKKYLKRKFYQKYFLLNNYLKEISHFVLLNFGVYLIGKGNLKLIDFFLIEEIGIYMMNAIEKISEIVPQMRYFFHILRKSNDFHDIEVEMSKKILNAFQPGDIVFDNITFSYDQYNYILKDVSMTIIKGNHILLMGCSGCGKSTLCKIMTQTETPTYGTIKINNINILDYPAKMLRNYVKYLPQKSKIIYGTIKENIVMNRPFNDQKFTKICEICRILEIVDKKPLRFETIVNETYNLSGGEKQRIILARTLFSDAEIFLFDESLSEVDEKLEKEIIKEIRLFLNGKTIIYISHRNHKKLFDKVIKLEECHERVFRI